MSSTPPATGWTFNAPPGWPPAPTGWTPAEGWTPDPSWPPAPPDWQWWLPASAPAQTSPAGQRAWPARHKGLTAIAAVLAFFVMVGAIDSLTETDTTDTAVASSSGHASDEATTPAPSPTTSSPTPTPTPTPTTSAPANPAQAIQQARPNTALALLGALAVKGRAAKTGYSRAAFGPAWTDTNRNGCDTRNDILNRDLRDEIFKAGTGGCAVLSGDLAPDPYTAQRIHFVRGGGSEVDIDHVVALSDAWQTGAAGWVFGRRLAFANDPLNLLAVDAPANRQKGDADAASWLPAHKSYRCAYVARQVAVKAKYRLWVTAAERAAIARVLTACPAQAAPTGGNPTIAPVAGISTPRPSATKTASSAPTRPPSGGGTDPNMGTCKAAIAAGYGPYYRGKDPEYAWYQDRDHVICTSRSSAVA